MPLPLAALCILAATPGGPGRAQAVSPSVVTLVATSTVASLVAALSQELGSAIELRQPAGLGALAQKRVASGIVIDGEGHVATTASFVLAGGDIEATLADGRVVPARLVGQDLQTDVAIVALAGATPPPARFETRREALATGQMLGVVGSAPSTRCRVGEGRLVQAHLHPGAGRLHDFLQLSSDFQPGTSGAAVIDAQGGVVGMVSAFKRGKGTLAVPARTVLRMADEIIKNRAVHRGWLGLTVASGPGTEAEDPERGARVMGVVTGSPAETAGIQPGDLIVGLDGTPIEDLGDLVSRLGEHGPGARVAITVSRGAREVPIETVLVERPEAENSSGVVVRLSEERPYLGVRTVALPVERRGHGASGILVQEVEAQSPAAQAGIRAGDVIVRIGDSPLSTPDDLSRALDSQPFDRPAEIAVSRDGESLRLSAVLAKRAAQTVLSGPQFHLAFNAEQWADLRQALRLLSPEHREKGGAELARFLERNSASLDAQVRRQIEALKRELLHDRKPADPAIAPVSP